MNKILSYITSSLKLQSIIIWVVVFIVLFIMQPLWAGPKLSFYITSVSIVSILVIYHLTQWLLIPQLLLKKRKVVYTICSAIMIVVLANITARFEMYVLDRLYIDLSLDDAFVFSFSKFITIFILTYAVSSIIFFWKKATEDAKQKEELLVEKRMLEVRVLKSQINSHFIFNALNNIYSMTYFKDEYTAGYVLKLAQMMRYVMEDCETELTPLYKEIEYIENFIDFQKLRFESAKDISFSCSTEGNNNISVPPMIFQPFVENCFKHTPLDVDKKSYIRISLSVNQKSILFVSENSQPLLKARSASKGTSIGIENVKRRLSLYYGDNYTLDIVNNAEYFKVELLINLEY